MTHTRHLEGTKSLSKECIAFGTQRRFQKTGESTAGRNPPGLQTASLILHSNTWIFHKAWSIWGGTAEFITLTRTATHASDCSPCLLGGGGGGKIALVSTSISSPGPLEHYWVFPKSRGKYCRRHFLRVERVGVTWKSCISSNRRSFFL